LEAGIVRETHIVLGADIVPVEDIAREEVDIVRVENYVLVQCTAVVVERIAALGEAAHSAPSELPSIAAPAAVRADAEQAEARADDMPEASLLHLPRMPDRIVPRHLS